MPIEFAEVNGHRLRYRIEGEGPLAVFGHGLLGSLEQVEENAPGLESLLDRVRLLTYDARGHGQSDGPRDPAGYTWETLGRDMAALAELHGEPQSVFGGASMGAASALWVGIEQPERVRALVLMMPPPLGHPPAREQSEQAAITMLNALAIAVEQWGMERTVEMLQAFPQFAASSEEGEERARWLLRQNPHTILHAIRGLLSSPYHDPEAYRGIKAPTLVIAHEGDGLHPMRAAKLLAGNIPGARLITGDRPGYWRDHPGELFAELERFMAAVG